MNVKVDTVDVPDGNGQTMRKKILVVTKDCNAGEVIYKVRPLIQPVPDNYKLYFVRRKTQLLQSSTSTCKGKVPTALIAFEPSKQAWPSNYPPIDLTPYTVPGTA